MRNILFDETGRIRSGWRIIAFLVVFFLFSTIFVIGEEALIGSLPIEPASAKTLYFIVNCSGLLFLALLFGYIAGKLFEDLPFRALGASFGNGWLKHLALGTAIGVGTLCFAVVTAFVLGGEKFVLNTSNEPSAVILSLLVSLVVLAVGAAWEEAFFRGYIFQTLTRSNLTWLAMVMTSAFFGIIHLANDNATWISSLNTALAGLWFGIAYLRTRDLWLAWGMHLAWNWTQGSVFGIEVSGMTFLTPNPLLKEIDNGPTWLTGTTYGIEGGVACTIALVVSIVVIYFLPISATECTETTAISK
jgi:membrane protease YdiL (CAAX protease family)